MIGSVFYTINAGIRAWVAKRRDPSTLDSGVMSGGAEDRLSRIQHAVDAIALEVERISEGQRSTTRLLSEQSRPVREPARQLSPNTPV